jgi:hypothetical protein
VVVRGLRSWRGLLRRMLGGGGNEVYDRLYIA